MKSTPDFEKAGGLVPAVVQDAQTLEVLMLGYMNRESWEKTRNEGKVTFFSRSKQRLWTKGETSGNYLLVKKMSMDCDNDTVLIQALPSGPACHTGQRSCFGTDYNQNFIFELENIIAERFNNPSGSSYVNSLRQKGLKKIAQKVGEEGTETALAAVAESDEAFIGEASDLLFHLLVLLREKKHSLKDVAACLENRHQKKTGGN